MAKQQVLPGAARKWGFFMAAQDTMGGKWSKNVQGVPYSAIVAPFQGHLGLLREIFDQAIRAICENYLFMGGTHKNRERYVY